MLKGKVSKSVGNRSKEQLCFDCFYPIIIAKKAQRGWIVLKFKKPCETYESSLIASKEPDALMSAMLYLDSNICFLLKFQVSSRTTEVSVDS